MSCRRLLNKLSSPVDTPIFSESGFQSCNSANAKIADSQVKCTKSKYIVVVKMSFSF